MKDRAVSLVTGTHFSGGDALVFLARRKTSVLQCVGLFPLPVAHMSITDLTPVASSSSSSAAQPPTALACHPARPWLVAAFAAAVGDARPLPAVAAAAAAVTGPSPT